MTKFKIGKLVRDKLAKLPASKGVHKLAPEDFRAALKLKLIEEAEEVQLAISPRELMEEIGDVQEVLECLIQTAGLDPEEIARIKAEKKNHKGGFTEALYVDHIEVEPGSDLEKRYLEDGDKYPQLP